MSAIATRVLVPGHYVSRPLTLAEIADAHRVGTTLETSLIRYEPASGSPHWYFAYYGGLDDRKFRAKVYVIVPGKVDFTAGVWSEDNPREALTVHEELEEIEEQEDDPDSANLYFFRLVVR